MKRILISLVAIATIVACSEDIDLKLSSTSSRLVVDGHLFDCITSNNYVRLTKSTNYFSNQPSPMVSGAKVVVSDGTNEYVFAENDSLGYYKAPMLFAAQHGRTYTLTISDVDIDGDGSFETYTATSATPPTYDIDSVQCTYDSFFEAYKVGLFAHEDTASADFYMFGVALNDSLISTSYTALSKTSDKWFSSDYCWGATIYLIFDDDVRKGKVEQGDKITLYAMSITEEFYNYVSALEEIANGSNPMFSSTPANAVGNISGDALGFFSVIAIVDKDCYVLDTL